MIKKQSEDTKQKEEYIIYYFFRENTLNIIIITPKFTIHFHLLMGSNGHLKEFLLNSVLSL